MRPDARMSGLFYVALRCQRSLESECPVMEDGHFEHLQNWVLQ
jgi:hypothetical protein